MSRRVPWDEQLKEARKRNAIRLQREEERHNPARYIEMRKSEVITLAVAGGITLIRPIAPQHMRLRLWQCPYGRVRSTAWVKEPFRYWGKDPENAFYRYSDDAHWHELDGLGWLAYEKDGMPIKARRFCISILEVKRLQDARTWEIRVERLKAD